jgi:hypothetical protein
MFLFMLGDFELRSDILTHDAIVAHRQGINESLEILQKIEIRVAGQARAGKQAQDISALRDVRADSIGDLR